jgi:hypothetical protein
MGIDADPANTSFESESACADTAFELDPALAITAEESASADTAYGTDPVSAAYGPLMHAASCTASACSISRPGF